MSTHRLELMAAILGLHLTLTIPVALNMSIAQAGFWSDSMDLLYCIRGKGQAIPSLRCKQDRRDSEAIDANAKICTTPQGLGITSGDPTLQSCPVG